MVDLAALLMLSPQMGSSDESTVPYEALAYVVLRVAGDLHDSCDVRLQLGFIVSLGLMAPYDGVAQELERASDLCGADPTPLWLLGSLAARQSR